MNHFVACFSFFWLRSPTSPNVFCLSVRLSVCLSESQVEILLQCAISTDPECSRMHAECSGMFQNACRMFQNACSMFQNVPNACRMFQNVPECMHPGKLEFTVQKVPECMQNDAECFRMHAEWSRMFLNVYE